MPTTGFLWEFVTQSRDTVAASATFQAWVGAANAPEALPYIFLFETSDDDDLAVARFCTVGMGDPVTMKRVSAASGLGAFDWTKSARVGLFEKVSAYSAANATSFVNAAGGILADILDAQGSIRRVVQTPQNECPLRWTRGKDRGYQFEVTLGAEA